jgi:hypothetical protein
LRGQAELIRFADDFVVVCEKRADAEALLEQVSARFQSYGLAIHPEKTRIVDFTLGKAIKHRRPLTSSASPTIGGGPWAGGAR